MLEETIERMLEKQQINLKELKILMTPLERTILTVLMKKKAPLTVNEIRNVIIEDFWQLIKYYGRHPTEAYKEEVSGIVTRIEPIQRFPSYTPKLFYWYGDYEHNERVFFDIYHEIEKIKREENPPKYKIRNKIAELLKKHEIVDIPSFSSINKILIEFEAIGIVLSRNEVVGRGKKLYVINPKLIEKEK